MKKIFKNMLIIMSMVLAFSTTTVFADNTIKVLVNDKQVSFDVEPTIINGRTMVPIRAIFEAMDANVEWDAETSTATAIRDGLYVTLQLGDKTLYVGGDYIVMDVEPVIIEGRILVPARYVGEAFSCDVGWDAETKTVSIISKDYLESLSD